MRKRQTCCSTSSFIRRTARSFRPRSRFSTRSCRQSARGRLMRISTQSTYENTIQNMDNQQSMLARLEQQASTGIRVATPGDDPLGAAQAVQLSAEGSALAQFASNQNTATSLLQTEGSTLSSVTSTLQDVLTQLNALGAGDVNDSNGQAAAKALQGLRDQLMSLANTKDSNGNYIFSGFQGKDAPFSNASNGGVVYN